MRLDVSRGSALNLLVVMFEERAKPILPLLFITSGTPARGGPKKTPGGPKVQRGPNEVVARRGHGKTRRGQKGASQLGEVTEKPGKVRKFNGVTL